MIIADDYTARRIGYAAVEHGKAVGFSTFTYQQPRSGLTLYGVALKLAEGGEREVRSQLNMIALAPPLVVSPTLTVP